MDDSTKATIEKFQTKLAALEEQVRKIKISINGLCELEGEAPLYDNIEPETAARVGAPLKIRSDQFFGRPLATVAKEILGWRAQRNEGAISLEDMLALMKQGGFEPEGKDDGSRRRTIGIALGKNPAFVRVPSTGHYGLAEWYPNIRRARSARNEESDSTLMLPEPSEEISRAENQTDGDVL